MCRAAFTGYLEAKFTDLLQSFAGLIVRLCYVLLRLNWEVQIKATLAALVFLSVACPAAAGPTSNFAYMQDLTECQVQYLSRFYAQTGDYVMCFEAASQYAC